LKTVHSWIKSSCRRAPCAKAKLCTALDFDDLRNIKTSNPFTKALLSSMDTPVPKDGALSSIFDALPSDIICTILGYLPMKDVVMFVSNSYLKPPIERFQERRQTPQLFSFNRCGPAPFISHLCNLNYVFYEYFLPLESSAVFFFKNRVCVSWPDLMPCCRTERVSKLWKQLVWKSCIRADFSDIELWTKPETADSHATVRLQSENPPYLYF
jgi:hypothetical protein